jgi:hypothetical protein
VERRPTVFARRTAAFPVTVALDAARFARYTAIRSISFAGTGSPSGKRIVPLLTSYGASSRRNVSATPSVAG